MGSKHSAITLLMLFLCTMSFAQDQEAIPTRFDVTLQGIIEDGTSGAPLSGIQVDVFRSSDHVNSVAQTKTDEKGFYTVGVESGYYYDIYLRVAQVNPTQRTPENTQPNRVYNINFKILSESGYSESALEKYSIYLVGVVALLVLALIVSDQLLSKKRGPSKKDLGKEKREIENQLEVAREKYHKREIDADSFKEISSKKQARLIEIESKIKD